MKWKKRSMKGKFTGHLHICRHMLAYTYLFDALLGNEHVLVLFQEQYLCVQVIILLRYRQKIMVLEDFSFLSFN